MGVEKYRYKRDFICIISSMVDPFLRKNTEEQSNQASQAAPNPSPEPAQVAAPAAVAPQSPTPPAKQVVPKGKVISLRTILFGCLGFFVVLVGIGALVLYMMVQNPDQYANIGLDRATIQVLLQTFALLFFGVLFFVWFGLLLVNGYKFITVKNKPRLWYMMLSVIGFVVLLFSIWAGAAVLNGISNLEVNRGVDASSLVVPYLVLQSGPTNILTNPDLTLIAPASMVFQLNGPVFTRQVTPTLGPVDIQSITMTCGNGTTLTMNPDGSFNGSCTYFTRGDYPVTLSVTHVNRQTTETLTNTYEMWSLPFVSEIVVSVQDGEVVPGVWELVAGKAPRKITWDASAVFRDLGLPDYRIVWDVDGDGENDAENVSDVTWIYNEPKLYNVVVRFPGINTFAYSFPLRIEQPDVPICILSATQIQWTNYRIQAQMTGRTARIDAYNFSILDIADARAVVGRQQSTTNVIDYNFPWQWLYAIKLDFVTSDGRPGTCESQNISVGQADFTITYDIFYRTASAASWTKVDDTTPVSFDGTTLTIQELPTIVQVRITDIQPISATANTALFFNGAAILASNDNVFELRVNQRDNNMIKIVVDDPVRSAKTEQDVSVVVDQAPIIGKLEIKPDTVGNDPFTVTFDASATVLSDPTDEIVYFSWNFGDGIVKPNVSQSVIVHTYRYNYDTENGVFKPSVEILTKKWRSITIRPSDDIIVKKAVDEVVIRVDSHPAQVAKIGDKVEFALDISGLPEKIVWDFGDGNTLEFPWRQWVSASHIFTQNKEYSIKAIVTYENQPSIEGRIVLKVQ